MCYEETWPKGGLAETPYRQAKLALSAELGASTAILHAKRCGK